MATAGGIGQGIAAAVNGFMKGRQLAKDWAEAEEDREWKKTARDRQQKEWDAADAEVNMLKDAGAERVVQEIPDAAGTQAYMKATEQGPAAETPQIDFTAPSGFAVALQPSADGKTPMKFDNVAQLVDTREAASAAAQQANTPQNMAQRMSDGYMRLGKPKEAMAIATQQLSVEKAQQDAADRVWNRDLGQAMWSGHEGLAALGSRSEFGPMKGMQVKAVKGDDGMVNYMRVGKDGQLASLGLPAFSDDMEGITRAGAMLNHLTPPEARLEFLLAEKKAARDQANLDRNYNLAVRAQDRADRSADRQDAYTDFQMSQARRKADDELKLPPAVKLQVEAQQDELKAINSAILKSQADGSWDPNTDGAKQLLKSKASLSMQIRSSLDPYTKKADAPDPLGMRKGESKAPANVQEFVRRHQADAEQVAKQLNTSPQWVLGQWGLETGWGKSVIPGTNNLGNIKDFSGKGPSAKDNMTGSVDAYRKYGSTEEFGQDFVRLVGGGRYSGVSGAKDAQSYFAALKSGGYAEDPDYVNKGVSAARMVANAMGGGSAPAEAPKPANVTQRSPAPAPAKAAPAKPPTAAPAPARTTDPVEVAGQRLDAARQALKDFRAARAPGLAAGREALNAHAAKLNELQRAVAAAEQQYQQVLPASAHQAFGGQNMAMRTAQK
ncbi:glycoside hydrolase family 73 protein [Comamonas serinivorans]|nr:glucosaminidase domain-containing protein [Comamonas serinivorans]